jgi:hypothetical protein
MEQVYEENKITTEVNNKKTNKERMKEWEHEIDEIHKRMKEKDYILTIYTTGCSQMSRGDYEREIFPNIYYEVCSLEEIPEKIRCMKRPFWSPEEEGLSKKEIKNYPYEKKKWGRFMNIVIEPLSKELEENYIDGCKRGFFDTWRRMRDKGMLDK